MPRLKLTNRVECPPDKYQYTHPEDGWRDESFSMDGWFRAIQKHKRDNGYETPEDWKEIAEDQLCRLLPPGWCQYDGGGEPERFIEGRLSLNDIITGTRVLTAFVASGCHLVDQDEAESRARTCASCYALRAIPGCAPCVGFANIVAEVCGAKKTKADAALEGKSCLVCRCSAKANVWVPVEVSRAGVTPEMMATFPEFCWKRNQIEALTKD